MTSQDFTAQANRAATELLAEIDVSLPVESYEILHAIAAVAYTKGHLDGLREAVDAHNAATNETLAALTDPRDST